MESEPAGDSFGTFLIVWIGQLVSVLGSTLTGFAMGIWVFIETGSVTTFALIIVTANVPGLVAAPLAGSVVDRVDRRLVMLVADIAAGVSTGVAATLFLTGALEIWHLYPVAAVGAIANAFQEPAYGASVPLLVPKRHLGRANGLVQAGPSLGAVVAPIMAAALVATAGLGVVLIIDLVTFVVAVATLTVVRIPRPEAIREDEAGASLWRSFSFGWNYLRARPGLLGLLGVYAVGNFMLSAVGLLYLPLILAFSTETAYGAVMSVGGAGMLLGSVVMSAWGGPRRRIAGIMGMMGVAGVGVALAGIWESVWLIAVFGSIDMFLAPIINGTSQTLWQTKVAPAVQGRVFAVRRMVAFVIYPVSLLLTGPLADRVFEPALMPDGVLAGSVGLILGTGRGRGVGLMIVMAGVGTTLAALWGWRRRSVRSLETEVPDALEVPST